MKVSVVIPAYNAQKYIAKAVESVLKQDIPKKDLEVIMVNDGSTDRTFEILKKYHKEIFIINQKNRGAVKAANIGFRRSKGKYVIKLDADDWFMESIICEMADVLDENSSIDFVYSDYLERKGKIEKVIRTGRNIFRTVAGGIMFRRDKLAKEGFYREDLKFPEYDILLRTIGRWKGYHISKPLFVYNRVESSVTQNKKWVDSALKELVKIHPARQKEISKIRSY